MLLTQRHATADQADAQYPYAYKHLDAAMKAAIQEHAQNRPHSANVPATPTKSLVTAVTKKPQNTTTATAVKPPSPIPAPPSRTAQKLEDLIAAVDTATLFQTATPPPLTSTMTSTMTAPTEVPSTPAAVEAAPAKAPRKILYGGRMGYRRALRAQKEAEPTTQTPTAQAEPQPQTTRPSWK